MKLAAEAAMADGAHSRHVLAASVRFDLPEVCAGKTFQTQCFPMNQFSEWQTEVVSRRVAVAL